MAGDINRGVNSGQLAIRGKVEYEAKAKDDVGGRGEECAVAGKAGGR